MIVRGEEEEKGEVIENDLRERGKRKIWRERVDTERMWIRKCWKRRGKEWVGDRNGKDGKRSKYGRLGMA